MSEWVHILARGDDDWIKIVSGLVVLVLWALSALSSATGKKKKDEQRRREYGRMPEDVANYGGTGPVPPPPPPFPVPPRPQQQQGKQKSRGQKARKKQQPVPVAAAPPASSYSTPPAAPMDDVPTRAKPASTAAPANRIGRLLRRPDSLRAAFILNEVISPPVTMRDQAPRR